MKTLRLVGISIAAVSVILMVKGCSQTKLTEGEARKRAEANFERQCKVIIHYETNEFNSPELSIGTSYMGCGGGVELCYQYIWNHKSENLKYVVSVSESGPIAGGPGPIDYDKPLPPPRKRSLNGTDL